MTRFKGFQLEHFQIRAVEAIRAGHDVLVSAPTGAGKTLVAEYAIEDSVRRGRRCVYTAPIKALSNQKYRDFRDDPRVDVGLMTGDVTIHPGAQVLIMTTEIFRNSIFENPDALRGVEYVIFDEIHFLDDLERGTVWEESLIFAPESIRFICLSATVSNLEQLGEWIRQIRPHDLEVIRSAERPVPLEHRLYAPWTGFFDVSRAKRARAEAVSRAEIARRSTRRGGRRGGRDRGRGRGRPGRDRGDERAVPQLDPLLDEILKGDLLPALVFAFSRRDCERLALKSKRRRLLSTEDTARMARLQRELARLFRLDEDALRGDVFRLAARGIGYHHAGMLPIHKEVVERMFTSGLLKLLFTTETFALGINMPARTVVFHSLRKFDGVQFDYMGTRDYMQMAGRAGRQGIDSKGLVVSLLTERDLVEAPLERMVRGTPEPVESRFRLTYSTILHIVGRLGRERLHEAWEKSFDRFQHREKGRKAREKNRLRQRAQVDAHLALLAELDYLDEHDRPTARGAVASRVYGYELQVTECLFRGLLENCSSAELATVFVGLIHEERRRGFRPPPPSRWFGSLRRRVDSLIADLSAREARHRIPNPLKRPDWGLAPAVAAWIDGADFEELAEVSSLPPGDLCRSFRMAVQLMRQVRRSIDPSWSLADDLADAIAAVDRDEVDARRQLELG